MPAIAYVCCKGLDPPLEQELTPFRPPATVVIRISSTPIGSGTLSTAMTE
ncbi:MAG TPA: hypothetical protein VMT89_11540 [Candidatus Acidoferrales bacterium]|nr:hypothetical protein [Candidatus Acidoferrales bacterium]